MPLFVPSTILVLAYIAISAPAVAQQDGAREYQDSAWGTVMLPQGEKSFADRVVAYPPGIGTINETARDPRAILGPPDFSGDVNDGSFLSLGCDGSVIIQFSDNALIDVAGPDLYVFEVGPNVEGINLAISEDGASWINLGDISGGRAEVELAGLVPADASFRFVRLTDDGVECGTRFTEADFDAVAFRAGRCRSIRGGQHRIAHRRAGGTRRACPGNRSGRAERIPSCRAHRFLRQLRLQPCAVASPRAGRAGLSGCAARPGRCDHHRRGSGPRQSGGLGLFSRLRDTLRFCQTGHSCLVPSAGGSKILIQKLSLDQGLNYAASQQGAR